MDLLDNLPPTNMLSCNTILVHKRVGHVAVNYRHFIVVWGGFMVEKTGSDRSEYCPAEHLWIYNCITEVWSVALTKGQVPHKNSGSTGLILDDKLYVFGGAEEVNDIAWGYSNDLYKLDLRTLLWEKLEPKGERPIACDKAVGWVHGQKLYFFSGYGIAPRQGQPGTGWRWIRDEVTRDRERGWTNQLVWFDTAESKWGGCGGRTGGPPPRAAAAAATQSDTALIFGGRLGQRRMNDLYTLDLNTLQWSKNLSDGVGICDGRSWHSLDFVEKDKIVIYGGLQQLGRPSTSWWEVSFDVTKGNRWSVKSWKSHRMKTPLVWHKSAYCWQTGELVFVGGVTSSPYVMNIHDHVDRLFVLQFQPSSLFRLCLRCIVMNFKVPYVHYLSKTLPTILSDIIAARLLTSIK